MPPREAPPLPDWSNTDTAWLAGLLEGEGSFTASRQNGPQSPATPRVTVAMTDADVIARAAAMFNSRQLSKPTYPTALGRERKPQTQTIAYGAKAVAIMRRVRPYMGARRAARIDELIADWFGERPHLEAA